MSEQQKYPHMTLRVATQREVLEHVLIYSCVKCGRETGVMDSDSVVICQFCQYAVPRDNVAGWEIERQRTFVHKVGQQSQKSNSWTGAKKEELASQELEVRELRAWKRQQIDQLRQWDGVIAVLGQLFDPKDWGGSWQEAIIRRLREHAELQSRAKETDRWLKKWELVVAVLRDIDPERAQGYVQGEIIDKLREWKDLKDANARVFPTAFLESQQFYELCQRYRSTHLWAQPQVVEAFETLKRYIRGQISGKPVGPQEPEAEQ